MFQVSQNKARVVNGSVVVEVECLYLVQRHCLLVSHDHPTYCSTDIV